jgi:hypothetical protein
MIFAQADVDTRVKLRAALPNDDIPSEDVLAAISLYAEPFGF